MDDWRFNASISFEYRYIYCRGSTAAFQVLTLLREAVVKVTGSSETTGHNYRPAPHLLGAFM